MPGNFKAAILGLLLPLILPTTEATAGGYRITDLGRGIIPAAINCSGDVTGTVVSPFSAPEVFLRRNGVVTRLGLLGGYDNKLLPSPGNSWVSRDTAKNDKTQVTGSYQDRKWVPMFGMASDTENLSFAPAAINNAGIMVGCAVNTSFLTRKSKPRPKWMTAHLDGAKRLIPPCVPATFAGGKVKALAEQLAAEDDHWILEGVFDLNDNGEIIGYGTKNGQALHGFILSPSR